MSGFLNNHKYGDNPIETDSDAKKAAAKVSRKPGRREDSADITVVVSLKTGKVIKENIGRVAVSELTTLQLLADYYLGEYGSMYISSLTGGVVRTALVHTKEVESVEFIGTADVNDSDEDVRSVKLTAINPDQEFTPLDPGNPKL